MLNQVVIVGRIVKTPELRETETGRYVTNVILAVDRSFKNSKLEYDTDFIDCVLWRGIAENTVKYCDKGSLIGLKGRIQNRTTELEDGSKKYYTEIVAEKVTFLSQPKKAEDNKVITEIEDEII